MSSKPLEVRVLITELPTLVEKKSKQTDLNDTPEPMSLLINDLSYLLLIQSLFCCRLRQLGIRSEYQQVLRKALSKGRMRWKLFSELARRWLPTFVEWCLLILEILGAFSCFCKKHMYHISFYFVLRGCSLIALTAKFCPLFTPYLSTPSWH